MSISVTAMALPKQSLDNLSVIGDDKVISLKEYDILLNETHTIKNSTYFRDKRKEDIIVLTAKDLFYIWLYSDDVTTTNDLISSLNNAKSIDIRYDNLAFSVVVHNNPIKSIAPYSGEGYFYDTNTIYSNSAPRGLGIRIDITAKFRQVWHGGNKAYSEYISYTKSTSPIKVYKLASIIDGSQVVKHSVGLQNVGKAYLEYTCKTTASTPFKEHTIVYG